MSQLQITTQRQRIIEKWKASGRPYITTFKAYKSTAQVQFDVVQPLGGTAAEPAMAHAVARAGQTIEFFSYGMGEAIPYGPAPMTRRANAADTNLARAHSTNGQEDFVIEGASLTASSTRVAYDQDLLATIIDPDVIGAYRGNVPLHDPASLIAPPQVSSPFNLEQVLMQAVAPLATFEIEFDRRRKEQIGTLDQVPEGGAKSFLRAHGDPRTDNRIRFPEGYVWMGEGQPDSEMIVRATLKTAVVIPISTVEVLAMLNVDAQQVPPKFLFLDLALRVHGLSCGPQSRN